MAHSRGLPVAGSHKSTLPSAVPPARVLPSGVKARQLTVGAAADFSTVAEDRTRSLRTTAPPAFARATVLPSGAYATATTRVWLSLGMPSDSFAAATFHIRKSPSEPTVARAFPSGEMAREAMPDVG